MKIWDWLTMSNAVRAHQLEAEALQARVIHEERKAARERDAAKLQAAALKEGLAEKDRLDAIRSMNEPFAEPVTAMEKTFNEYLANRDKPDSGIDSKRGEVWHVNWGPENTEPTRDRVNKLAKRAGFNGYLYEYGSVTEYMEALACFLLEQEIARQELWTLKGMEVIDE
ncbi:hypothetical protein [uncultured Paraglaciecola sp.]|uniref:hypothetical protein n=1 Tax=uncultured Paraglaciecola sp. TaxID=1765024 RepID=UPI0026340122|nr:hypothetical protein [uncultured Paraglaciecola sp.]